MAEIFTVEELLLNEDFIKFCTDPDAATVSTWEQLIAQNKVNPETVNEARSILQMLGPRLSKAEIAEEVNKLQDLIGEEEEHRVVAYSMAGGITEERLLTQKRKSPFGRIVAAVALLACISFVIFFISRSGADPSSEIVATFKTGTGEQKKLVLPDGTHVILNSNTSISYTKGYDESERVVHLNGNAFFKVTKNPQKPFSVISQQFSTTALGTAFYVSSDSSDNYSVKLLEGKVKINTSRENETALLTAGEEISWQKGYHHFQKHNYDTAYLSNWASGKITFNKTPFAEAIKLLEQWYGVEIVDERNDKKSISINGTYENVFLEDILKVICFSMSCNITDERGRIMIR